MGGYFTYNTDERVLYVQHRWEGTLRTTLMGGYFTYNTDGRVFTYKVRGGVGDSQRFWID